MGPQGTLHGHDNALLCLPLYFFISTGLCWLTTVCCPTREHVLYLTAANRQRSAQRRFPMHLAPEFPESPDARGTMGANGRNRGKGACVCGKPWPTRPNAFVVWICLRQKWIRTGAPGPDLCLWAVPLEWGGAGGWVGLWPLGGWVSLVLGNLAQRAYFPPWGGGSGWVGGQLGRGWVGPDSPKVSG